MSGKAKHAKTAPAKANAGAGIASATSNGKAAAKDSVAVSAASDKAGKKRQRNDISGGAETTASAAKVRSTAIPNTLNSTYNT